LWFAAAVLTAAPALAAAAQEKPDPNVPPAAPYDMSASDVGAGLARLLLERPPVPVTPPTGAAAPRQHPDLPPDGSMVIDRPCELGGQEDGWRILRFEAEPGASAEPPRRLLPCRLLELMEDQAARSPLARFRVSGETTVFGDRAYLMVRKVTVLDAPAPAAPPPKPPPGPAAAPAPAPPATSRPATPTTAPSSDDVFRRLMAEKVGRPVLVPTAAAKVDATPSVAPGPSRELPPDRGSMVVDRVVRVVPEGGSGGPAGWWVARFESDNTLAEPPARLLPCQFLQAAQEGAGTRLSPAEPRYRLTGEMTVYRHRRYVLIRKLLPDRDMGEF